MFYLLGYLVLVVGFVYWLCNGILKATGWTDPQERRAATIAVMTAVALNSDKAKKPK